MLKPDRTQIAGSVTEATKEKIVQDSGDTTTLAPTKIAQEKVVGETMEVMRGKRIPLITQYGNEIAFCGYLEEVAKGLLVQLERSLKEEQIKRINTVIKIDRGNSIVFVSKTGDTSTTNFGDLSKI